MRLFSLVAGSFFLTVLTAGAQQLQFVEVTESSGLVYAGTKYGGGVSVGDVNGDGWEDVLMFGGGEPGTRLFLNNTDGTFTDVTATRLPPDIPQTSWAGFADADNDGDLDLLVAAWHGTPFLVSFSYHENIDGVFQTNSAPPMLGMHDSAIGGLAIGDIDRDGDIDVIFTHYYGPGYCLINDGNGGWSDGTEQCAGGINESRRHWSTVLADFNNDGWPDYFAAIDYGHDFYAKNLGNSAFVDHSVEAGVSHIGSDMGVAVADIDGDGDLDMFTSNIANHALYVNQGDGTFINEAAQRGVKFNGMFGTGWGTMFADFDLDGDEDLVFIVSNMNGSIYTNDGNGYFTNVSAGSGMLFQGVGLAVFDYDRDGDMDILIMLANSVPRFYKNVTNTANHHWLMLDLRGSTTNRRAVGARVYATAGGKSMTREVILTTSFVSGQSHLVHLGLGESPVADTVRVVWTDGSETLLSNVPGNQYLTIMQEEISHEPTLSKLTVTGTPVVPSLGTASFIAIAQYSDGKLVDVSNQSHWSVSPPICGTITGPFLQAGLSLDKDTLCIVKAGFVGFEATWPLHLQQFPVEPEEEPLPPDLDPPTLGLLSPALDRNALTTDIGFVTLTGWAEDISGVVHVGWLSSAGTSSNCDGTQAWTCGPIELQHGINELTVFAMDPYGHIAELTVTVDFDVPGPPPTIVAIPSFIDFGSVEESTTLSLSLVGLPTIGYQLIASHPAITVTPTTAVLSDKTVSYHTVVIDRNLLAPGSSLAGEIFLQPASGAVTPVTIQISATQPAEIDIDDEPDQPSQDEDEEPTTEPEPLPPDNTPESPVIADGNTPTDAGQPADQPEDVEPTAPAAPVAPGSTPTANQSTPPSTDSFQLVDPDQTGKSNTDGQTPARGICGAMGGASLMLSLIGLLSLRRRR